MTKLALVTGGTRGIGEAISITLAKAGYKVAASYASNEQKAKEFTERTGIAAYKFDASKYDECKEAVNKIHADFGQKVEILVNNAGITSDGMLHKVTSKGWHDVIETNLTSVFNMCHLVINDMRAGEFGRIVNISSINGLTGQIGQTNYSAAKAGVIGFTQALARETARKNITVNAIAPGYIDTDMLKAMPEDVLKSIIAQIPVGRLGDPFEIANVVSFLVGEHSGFITGETISINGGQFMG